MKLKRIPFDSIPQRESLPELAETVQSFRLNNGLSQRELADLAGVATISVARIERRIHVCRTSTWEALVAVMARKGSIPSYPTQGELFQEPPVVEHNTVKQLLQQLKLLTGAKRIIIEV